MHVIAIDENFPLHVLQGAMMDRKDFILTSGAVIATAGILELVSINEKAQAQGFPPGATIRIPVFGANNAVYQNHTAVYNAHDYSISVLPPNSSAPICVVYFNYSNYAASTSTPDNYGSRHYPNSGPFQCSVTVTFSFSSGSAYAPTYTGSSGNGLCNTGADDCNENQ